MVERIQIQIDDAKKTRRPAEHFIILAETNYPSNTHIPERFTDFLAPDSGQIGS